MDRADRKRKWTRRRRGHGHGLELYCDKFKQVSSTVEQIIGTFEYIIEREVNFHSN